MDAALSAPIAPAARIHRRTSSQRRFLPQVEATVAGLDSCAALADETQARALVETRLPRLGAALTASPHYRRALGRLGLSPRDLTRLEDLQHFPTLARETLATAWPDLPVLEGRAAEEMVLVRSSGTTGDPVTVPRDRYDCLHMWAVLRFWLARLRVELPPRPRVVLLCALPGGLEYSVRLPLLGDGALHRLSLPRGRAAERLRRVAPAVLFSDPEGLHWLAAQEGLPAPRIVLTSAQHFSADQRGMLAATLPAPVVNYYATTETGPIAWECLVEPARFHVLAPDVWVESVDGELVVTRLRPSLLPLLRYRTGDTGRVDRHHCACGFHGWSLSGFEGRRACAFRLPSGETVDAWGLAWLFKHHPLRSFRLVQEGPQRFALAVSPEAEPALVERLRRALSALGWDAPQVDLRPWAGAETGAKPAPFACAWTPRPPQVDDGIVPRQLAT